MCNNSANNNTDKDLLVDFWGSTTFLKVYQALNIGKIKFSFVMKDNPKESIDYYLDADVFHSDLIDIIKSGELVKRVSAAKQKGLAPDAKHYGDIWKAPANITSDNKVRTFAIQPGIKSDLVLRATMGTKSITVPVEWYRLKLMAERWRFLVPDYEKMMRAHYNITAMDNSYHGNRNQR